jgi:hypothetical protein
VFALLFEGDSQSEAYGKQDFVICNFNTYKFAAKRSINATQWQYFPNLKLLF